MQDTDEGRKTCIAGQRMIRTSAGVPTGEEEQPFNGPLDLDLDLNLALHAVDDALLHALLLQRKLQHRVCKRVIRIAPQRRCNNQSAHGYTRTTDISLTLRRTPVCRQRRWWTPDRLVALITHARALALSRLHARITILAAQWTAPTVAAVIPTVPATAIVRAATASALARHRRRTRRTTHLHVWHE